MNEKTVYAPVTREIVSELQAIVGEKNIIFSDPELLQNYAHDEVAGPEYARMPEVVVKPASASEISEIMKLANRQRVPVTPRGGGREPARHARQETGDADGGLERKTAAHPHGTL